MIYITFVEHFKPYLEEAAFTELFTFEFELLKASIVMALTEP